MNIEEIELLYRKHPSSFSAKYKTQKEFRDQIDPIMNQFFPKYGKLWKEIFNDLQYQRELKVLHTYDPTLDDANQIAIDYINDPKKFSNDYKNSKKSARGLFHKKIDTIVNKFYPEYNNKPQLFKKMVFHIINKNVAIPKCLKCSKNGAFNFGDMTYRQYCSAKCSRKAGFKGPKKGTIEYQKMVIRRNKTMHDIRNDAVKGQEYRQKLKDNHYSHRMTETEKKLRSEWLKTRIANGDWTPKVNNSWTHWTVNIDGKKFRSSFEGLFYLYNKIVNNANLEYEKLRIPYQYENETKIYIVDFISNVDKKCFEIKPNSLTEDPKNIAKQKALQDWCAENKFENILITETELKVMFNSIKHIEHEFLDKFNKTYKWA